MWDWRAVGMLNRKAGNVGSEVNKYKKIRLWTEPET